MVGMVSRGWGDKAEVLLSSLRGTRGVASKMERLRQLRELILSGDPTLLPAFAPRLTELSADQPSPVRRLLAEAIGEIGVKHVELLPRLVPTLISFLSDETPPVARQAIISGTSLFSFTLEKVAIQGLRASEMENSLEASWISMLDFKDAVFPLAFEHGNDGVRLLAIKFIEVLILLYTPDPNVSPEGPLQVYDNETGFNASWLRVGHPILSVGDLSTEATQSLASLLGQLRPPQVKSISNAIIIVLINSLSSVAQKRPSFYGRILPVLLQLDPACSVIKGVDFSRAFHALKNAFVAFLKCTHQGAAPWRTRLVEALKTMNAGKLVDQVIHDDLGTSDTVNADTCVTKEERVRYQTFNDSDGDHVRKRIKVEVEDIVTDESLADKSHSYIPSQIIGSESFLESFAPKGDNDPSSGLECGPVKGEVGPLQQLIGVFGALVSQGDKAIDSLDILISNIPIDLMADMVMANMHHLPPTCPKNEEDGLTASCSTAIEQLLVPSSSFLSNILSLSSTLSSLNAQRTTSHDSALLKCKDEAVGMSVESILPSCTMDIAIPAISNINASISVSLPGPDNTVTLGSHIKKEVSLDGEIPGLGSMNYIDDIQGSLDASYSTTELGGSQEQLVSSESTLLDTTSLGTMSTYTSELHGPRIVCAEASEVPPSSSSCISSQLVLPKMIAPVIDISNEDKDHLQKVSFTRIIDTYKQVAASGGSSIRLSLLACLGVEFPLELDVWDLLKKHISSDYSNHEGHELTLRVLYRLYCESEQDQDFFSSATATKDYEMFLLAVAESLRDLFPASDKSLSRLLGEVPYLPKSVIKLLECLCCPGSDEKHDKDFQGGDRVTQGLSAVWSLILMRPPSRDACLNIALQSAVHHLEEVRMKAIRLVANKLFPVTSIAQRIEEFASEMLLSVIDDGITESEGTAAGCSPKKSSKDAHTEKEQPPVTSNEASSDCPAQNTSSSSVADAQRRMSLYFALCTKKHSLLWKFFSAYKNMPQPAKEAVHRHIPILVRTVGASAELLNIVSDPPPGCETILMQVLRTLTEGAVPSPELIASVKMLYENKLKNIEVLIPVLPFLSKEEVLPMFPQLVALPPDKLQAAVSRILQGSLQSGPSLTPEEILIAIHGIDPDKDSVSLKKVMDACTSCFEQRHIFTQQVIAKVLNQLVEQIPLPLLFMRTVIQAIGTYPALVDFVMDILSRLVNKQIWKYPKLWVGFLKCAAQTKSFNVLLQLPAAQLENALNRNPILKVPIVEHASQPNVRSTLPRSTLQVLGLLSEQHTSAPAQTSESQAADASNSAADGAAETTQETTSVT